ncbi:MAG: CpsD/CapB family tyrosine-protein kinase [Clostridiales bacterium]|nr:CpsD/CapB family tyrosine-protein kinase [Clostridiales bacterium]
MAGKKNKKLEHFDNDVPKIIVSETSGRGESYYRLKDNIIYSSDSGKNKVFQFESAISGEGKSTVVSNTAVALALSGKKVVIVDLDFRRPKIHRIFSVQNVQGIAEYMLGEYEIKDIIKKTEYGVDVVNRGKATQNASIIFTSDKFKELIEELKKQYDLVLFDCPPVLLVSDYIHYSKLSDVVVFVACMGVTRRSQLREAVELMKKHNDNFLGTVVTYKNTGKFSSRYGGYYNNRYYKYLKSQYSEEVND